MDLDGVVEELREGGGKDSRGETGRDSVDGRSTKRRRSRKRRNSGGSDGPGQSSASGCGPGSRDPEEKQKGTGGGVQKGGQQTDIKERSVLPTQEDPRGQFYEAYHKEADDYDKEFMKKYDGDLDTTLIFAGLFSAIATAFILDVQPQLQPDTGDETVALLRVLIYKIDNTTFGNDTPALPQWSGPPPTIVQVQAILYASLTSSLLAAFLAVLGKQWLNRYALTDVRGTVIERSQNRQRKLDGIVAWYFDPVMESLPLMLQAALLLLGCALGRYLWEINITIASVVLAVTSFGVIVYLFVLVVGSFYESCPYQTPGAHILRRTFHYTHHVLLPALRSAPSVIASAISSYMQLLWQGGLFIWWRSLFKQPWYSPINIVALFLGLYGLPWVLLGIVLSIGTLALFLPIVLFVGMIYRFMHASPQIVLDFQCILWILQTSLDTDIRLSTLKHLQSLMSTPTNFDPALVAHCLDVFIGCVNIDNHGEVVVTQGSEQLAIVSAQCFFRTISYLSVMHPTSSILEDIYQRYNKAFPARIDFRGHQFSDTMNSIHRVFIRRGERHSEWNDYKPPSGEHTVVAQALIELTRFKYKKMQQGEASLQVLPPLFAHNPRSTRPTPSKYIPHPAQLFAGPLPPLPRFTYHPLLAHYPFSILDFAHYSLSLHPPPVVPVIVDCLSIIAVDLGCDISNAGTATLDESALVEKISNLITWKVKAMAEAEDHRPLKSKLPAIAALLPYAIREERDGNPEMFDVFLQAARASRVRWFPQCRVNQFASMLLSEASPRAIALASPHISWGQLTDGRDLIERWATTASALPYTEEIAQGVVDTLLQIASEEELVPYIPAGIWSWLTRQPSLPPICRGRHVGRSFYVLRAVQALENFEVLKSYLLLVWSEWDNYRWFDDFNETCTSIRENFGGIEMGDHRADLVQRINDILNQLDRGLEYFKQHDPEFEEGSLAKRKGQYTRLRRVLLDVERQVYATSPNIHSRSSSPIPVGSHKELPV